ncbi:MAG TPA: pyridoxamine 5'-phosphate oxidase family protein [Candidatus Dormibacteraeota bacterium]|nr:pyridoxamine 5'-phosphate oxidase family protein [Candidatus Dormibacteraeota bacterium]
MHEPVEPKAERMRWPGYEPPAGGRRLLEWNWAVERLRESRRYWLATAGSAGLPHLAAVWGVWSDGALVFSTGRRTRKAVNLGGRPGCAIATESGAEAVIVQGSALEVRDHAAIAAADVAYRAKYGSSVLIEDSPLFAVRPRSVVAIVDGDESKLPTRWRFP